MTYIEQLELTIDIMYDWLANEPNLSEFERRVLALEHENACKEWTMFCLA